MKRLSIVVNQGANIKLLTHLLSKAGQEDLCFATYVPSTGSERLSGLLREVILPQEDERTLHGNVSFNASYFERALQIASTRREGLVFIHSHLGPGWQGMSYDDIVAEQRIAPAVAAVTGMSLIGMTAGTDGSWSARFWCKKVNERRVYERHWCESVRVVGKRLSITFNENLLGGSLDREKQLRTISAWGEATQAELSRLTVGIVGLGSVGSIVSEILARTGIANFVLIDFDTVEKKNLDRLTNVFAADIGKAKVRAIKEAILRSASCSTVSIREVEFSVCEKQGFEEALNCDVLFSCVDRPWPRQVLNFISYAHLIPVIDGGIFVRTNSTNTKIKGADWKAHTVGYGRACLECLGQYKSENAKLEREGYLDDPNYIIGLADKSFFDAHENVFVFSSHLASLEALQLLSLVIAPSGISDVGQQMHHFVTGRMDVNHNANCEQNCFFPTISGLGDFAGLDVYSAHRAAELEQEKRSKE